MDYLLALFDLLLHLRAGVYMIGGGGGVYVGICCLGKIFFKREEKIGRMLKQKEIKTKERMAKVFSRGENILFSQDKNDFFFLGGGGGSKFVHINTSPRKGLSMDAIWRRNLNEIKRGQI
jgi:CRISPR/Cas system CMR-associated protein Cmr3 (group 5 of RAMP superfamily)